MGDKPIRYCAHLHERLALRRIPRELPQRIIRAAERVVLDAETGYRIALGSVLYRGTKRLMMVAFEETEAAITAVTVHPLEERDVEAKLRSGRWIA